MNPYLFWQVLAAVLAANLLTVTFVWSAIQVGRRERATEPLGVYIWGFILPIAFAGLSMYISFGGT
jgi:hypothetical protein